MKNRYIAAPALVTVLCVIVMIFTFKGSHPQESAEPDLTSAQYGLGVCEFGTLDVVADRENPWFYCQMQYPVTGLVDADASIYTQVRSVYDGARETLETRFRTEKNIVGKLNAGCNIYLGPEGYAGAEILGKYSVSGYSTNIVMTFNVDINRDILLENSDILNMNRMDDLLTLLQGKMESTMPELTASIDASWVNHIMLTKDGIVFLPPDGLQFGSSDLPQITLTYAELGDLCILFYPPADPTKQRIALTFDDGPSFYTKRILDTLEKYNARATFCILGSRAAGYADTIRRASGIGCEIISHSWDHKNLTELSAGEVREDLDTVNQVIYNITGHRPVYFRPPYGATNSDLRSVAAQLKMAQLMWSVDTRDWSSKNPDAIYRVITEKAQDGSIILCHDIYRTTAEAMERIIPDLIDKGFQFVTVSELLGKNPVPGEVYYHK